ncbi:MAG: histidine kinase dimerization/phosphoacceptor domain -containing protein [Reichenbachiella sp.]|uniref:tetratricopeptide repeat-containing sensor histidine kinase n=1 Tax=Reichenbachiella sp. TaxID=2184521 RepID=UPI00329835BD
MRFLKIPLFLFFVICQISTVRAQLDSLKQELNTAAGETRIDILNKIAFTFGYSNVDSARKYAVLAQQEAGHLNYEEGLLDSWLNLGYAYFDEGQTDTAIVIIKKLIGTAQQQKYIDPEMEAYLALGIMFDDKKKLDSAAWAYRQMIVLGKTHDKIQKTTAAIGNLGNLYRQQGLYDLAIAQYVEAAELNLEQGYDHKQANYLSNVGAVYLETEDYEKACEYSGKAYELIKDTDYTRAKWYARTGLCLALSNLGRFEEAEAGFSEILEEAKALNDVYQIPTSLHNLADTYNDSERYDEALVFCLEALERFEALESKGAIVQTHTLLCLIYGNLNQEKKGLAHCDIALEMAQANNLSSTLLDIYKIQSEVEALANQFEPAYHTRLLYENIKDEQLGKQKEKNIAALNTKFETREKELEIKVQQEKLEAQDQRISQQRTIQLLSLIVLIFVGGMAFLIWRNAKKQRQINKQLYEQKEVIEKTSKERETLLKEIHHRVKNNLQVISSLLSMQSRQMEEGEAKSAVREGQSRIKSMSLIHQKLYNQDELSRINMKEYIDELSGFLFNSFKPGDKIKQIVESEDILLDVDTAVPIGLIINELISNALKYAFLHAEEGQISISLKNLGNGCQLQVADTGHGLPEGFDQKQSMGMRLVHILVDQLNGELQIDQSKGTLFTIFFDDKRAA